MLFDRWRAVLIGSVSLEGDVLKTPRSRAALRLDCDSPEDIPLEYERLVVISLRITNFFPGHTRIARDLIPDWMNAIGLLLTALPESYWSVLNDRIIQLIGTLPEVEDIFQVITFLVVPSVVLSDVCLDP